MGIAETEKWNVEHVTTQGFVSEIESAWPVKALGFFFLLAAAYVAPWIVAEWRKTENAHAIAWVNVLLWWTGIVWLICLTLALSSKKEHIRDGEGQ